LGVRLFLYENSQNSNECISAREAFQEKTTSHRIRPLSGQQIATGVIENGVDIKKL
jgi:hypothetical protein